jgi:hypothetical protein
MSGDFVRDLEDELVAAARFRATRPAPRVAWPRRGLILRALATGAAAVLIVAAVLALVRGGNQAPRPGGPPSLPPGTVCDEVAPELRQRVAVLSEPARLGRTLPHAAIAVTDDFGATVPDGARYWGGEDGAEFWAVPVVPRGTTRCVPATEVCIVGVAGRQADAICADGPARGAVKWRMTPLPGGRTAIFGLVPDRAGAVEVELGDGVVRLDAGRNVFGGVVAVPIQAGDAPLPEIVPR